MSASDLQPLVERAVKGTVRHVVAGVQSGDGRIDLAAAAGVADVGGTAMTPETPYLLASISKMYTAAVILRLADEGRLHLSDPLAVSLPRSTYEGMHVIDGVDRSGEITIAQLLNHTSGLADYFGGKPKGGVSLADELKQGRDRSLDLDDVVRLVRTLPPRFVPGRHDDSEAHYSDTNFRLLAAVAAEVAGDPIEVLFDKLIFTKLGLEHTYPYAAVVNDGAPPPAASFAGADPLQVPAFLASHTPDGGVVATVADSLRFLRGFYGGELFNRNMVTLRWNRIFRPFRYALGTMRLEIPRLLSPFRAVPPFLGHAGSTGSFAFFIPARDLYVAGTVDQSDAPRKGVQLMLRVAHAVR